MKLIDLKTRLRTEFYDILSTQINDLRPSQQKALLAGLLEEKNLLVCTPTASGKTLIAEIAMIECILHKRGKAIYIVPLKALASEKFKGFTKKYQHLCRIALSIGDNDANDHYLENYDLIITTAEKLDSLLRHKIEWLSQARCVVVDEIHLLNDPSRGPTLEIMITLLRMMCPSMQLIALSATIGNPEELAGWLEAELVIDDWRPVALHKGIYRDGTIQFS